MTQTFSGVSVIGGQVSVQSRTGGQYLNINTANNKVFFSKTLTTNGGIKNTIQKVTGISGSNVDISPTTDVIELCADGAGINGFTLADGVATQKLKIVLEACDLNEIEISFDTAILSNSGDRVELSQPGETVSLCYTPLGWVVLDGEGFQILTPNGEGPP